MGPSPFLRIALLLVLSISCSGTYAQAPAPRSAPTLLLGPPNANNGEPMRELFQHPEQWARARAHTDTLYYADHAWAEFTDEELRAWMPQIKRWGLKMSMEVGAIKPWGTTGEVAFTKSRKNWDRLLADGAEIDSIAMDEPLVTTVTVLHKPMPYAVEETANYIALVRKNYPTWKIGEIEPYPGFTTPELLAFIDALQARLRQMHVRGLDFFRVDVDWMNFRNHTPAGKDGWPGLLDLERKVHNRGLPFSLVYWAADYPSSVKQGKNTPNTWEEGILYEGQAYQQVGGAPDQFVIQSWVGAPAHSIPENAPGTFMRSVDDFATRFLPPVQR